MVLPVAEALADLVGMSALHVEGRLFESRSPYSLVVKTGSDSSFDKRSATDVSVKGSWRCKALE